MHGMKFTRKLGWLRKRSIEKQVARLPKLDEYVHAQIALFDELHKLSMMWYLPYVLFRTSSENFIKEKIYHLVSIRNMVLGARDMITHPIVSQSTN